MQELRRIIEFFSAHLCPNIMPRSVLDGHFGKPLRSKDDNPSMLSSKISKNLWPNYHYLHNFRIESIEKQP